MIFVNLCASVGNVENRSYISTDEISAGGRFLAVLVPRWARTFKSESNYKRFVPTTVMQSSKGVVTRVGQWYSSIYWQQQYMLTVVLY